MINVKRLGHATLSTRDLEAQVDYYGRVLGLTVVERSRDRVFLASKQGLEAIEIVHGEPGHLQRLSFQLAPGTDLGDVAKSLKQAGFKCERRSGISPGVAEAVSFADPKGTLLDLFAEYTFPKDDRAPTGINLLKLGHVAYRGPDVQKITKFYCDVLGFRVSDWRGDFFVFLRCNADHHAANFLESTKFEGMHHVAYEMRDLHHLQTTLDHLAKHGYRLHWGPGRHGPGHNIFTYHRDPDGNVIELFTQLDVIHDESKGYFEPRPWHEDSPQFPKTWEVDVATANSWGPILPEVLDH